MSATKCTILPVKLYCCPACDKWFSKEELETPEVLDEAAMRALADKGIVLPTCPICNSALVKYTPIAHDETPVSGEVATREVYIDMVTMKWYEKNHGSDQVQQQLTTPVTDATDVIVGHLT